MSSDAVPDMPIADMVSAVIHRRIAARDAVSSLMRRDSRDEGF